MKAVITFDDRHDPSAQAFCGRSASVLCLAFPRDRRPASIQACKRLKQRAMARPQRRKRLCSLL